MKSLIALLLLFPQFALGQNLIEQGAKLYDQRENMDNVYEALKLFEKHLEKDPNSAEANWRASMANYYIGHLIKGRRKRKRHFHLGIKYAEKCVEITQGKLVDCHFWLGTNVALLKQEKGLLSMAFGLKEIFDHFETSRKLDPKYASSGPYRMLAVLSFRAPGFLGGDSSKAYDYIKTAIKNSPNEPLNVYFYAQFLVDDDREAEALKYMESFIAKADPKKFAFFESRKAFKNLKHYVKNKRWLEEP